MVNVKILALFVGPCQSIDANARIEVKFILDGAGTCKARLTLGFADGAFQLQSSAGHFCTITLRS